MTREEAYDILTKYMKGEHYLTHSLAVEAIMKGLAKRLAPDEVEYWGIAGLLHDLDEEQCDWQHDLSVHGPTSVEILKKEGIDDQCHLVKTLSGGFPSGRDILILISAYFLHFLKKLPIFKQYKKTDCHLPKKAIYFYRS